MMVAQDAPAAPASDTPDPPAAGQILLLRPAPASAPASGAPDEDSKAIDPVKAAATVLDEIQNAGDQRIPEEVLGSAQRVAVVPSMLKAGFIVGARYGRGPASCRTCKRLERSGILHRRRRKLRAPNWRPGRRPCHADHEQERYEQSADEQVQNRRRC